MVDPIAMRTLLLMLSALVGCGCLSTGYLAQAAAGQYAILHSARSIPHALSGEQLSPRVRWLLQEVEHIKAFGERRGLPATRNYTSYADLRREAAVWVVQACPPLSLEARRWLFPLVGSVPYLGFFQRSEAESVAEQLRRQGEDVDVRPASAYSTLGWFSDPVLSTMIPEGDEALGELANVILHESVHAAVYLPNQSAFDESLASFVADRLTLELLREQASSRPALLEAWQQSQSRYEGRIARLHRTFLELDALFRSGRTAPEKLAGKERILGEAQKDLGLSRRLNNAVLAGYRTYDSGGPHFARLLEACGGEWRRFLAAVRAVGTEDFAAPQQDDLGPVFEKLLARGCPAASDGKPDRPSTRSLEW